MENMSSDYVCADCGRPIRNLSTAWLCPRLDNSGHRETALIDNECAVTMHIQGFRLEKPEAAAEDVMLESALEAEREAKAS